ncbi:hypothetical protein LINPERHAP2_LOCUS33371 [Linum perenne]
MRIMNSALLAKWVWRYATERSAWWRKLIVTKCEIGVSEWMPTWNLGHAGHSFWRWVISFSPLLWKYNFLDPGGGGVCLLVRCLASGGEVFLSVSKDSCSCNILGSNRF